MGAEGGGGVLIRGKCLFKKTVYIAFQIENISLDSQICKRISTADTIKGIWVGLEWGYHLGTLNEYN